MRLAVIAGPVSLMASTTKHGTATWQRRLSVTDDMPEPPGKDSRAHSRTAARELAE